MFSLHHLFQSHLIEHQINYYHQVADNNLRIDDYQSLQTDRQTDLCSRHPLPCGEARSMYHSHVTNEGGLP